MPTEKPKPSSSTKAEANKKKSAELGEDELRRISGGMTSGGSAGSIPPVCVSQT